MASVCDIARSSRSSWASALMLRFHGDPRLEAPIENRNSRGVAAPQWQRRGLEAGSLPARCVGPICRSDVALEKKTSDLHITWHHKGYYNLHSQVYRSTATERSRDRRQNRIHRKVWNLRENHQNTPTWILFFSQEMACVDQFGKPSLFSWVTSRHHGIIFPVWNGSTWHCEL